MVMSAVGRGPSIFTEIKAESESFPILYLSKLILALVYLASRLLGVKADDPKKAKVTKLIVGETLFVNIGASQTGGRLLAVKGSTVTIALTTPACTEKGEKIALSRRIDKHWRLIGWGKVKAGGVLAEVVDV